MIICNVSGSNGVLNGGYETIRSFLLVKWKYTLVQICFKVMKKVTQAFIYQQCCLLFSCFCISKPCGSFAESENSLVQGDKQEEKLQTNEEAVCEEGSNKNDNDQETIDLENCVDLDEIPVLEHANTETDNDHKGIQRIKYT